MADIYFKTKLTVTAWRKKRINLWIFAGIRGEWFVILRHIAMIVLINSLYQRPIIRGAFHKSVVLIPQKLHSI